MDITLEATARDTTRGKSGARSLRQAGKLPAIVYGKDAATTAVAVDPISLDTIFRKTGDRNTIIYMDLDGTTVPVMVKSVSRHPLHRDIVHVDFYRLEPGQIVTAEVPVITVGRAIGFTLGGRIRMLKRTVLVRCAFTDIPKEVVIDITKMRVNDFITVSQLKPIPNVEFVYTNDYNVLTLYGKKSLANVAVEGEEGEEGAEGAEGEETAADSAE